MPTKIEKKRGVKYYRTIDLPGGKYQHIAITKKAGPHGGHTIAGPVHRSKKNRGCDHDGPCLMR